MLIVLLLNSAGELLFHKTVNVNDNIGTTNTKPEWLDAECAAAKSEYKKALHNFYRVKSIHSRNDMCNKKLCYKKLIKKKKNEYKVMLSNKMEALKNKSPKEFWSFFKNKRSTKSGDISDEAFLTYFKDLHTNDNTGKAFI